MVVFIYMYIYFMCTSTVVIMCIFSENRPRIGFVDFESIFKIQLKSPKIIEYYLY